MAFFIFYIMDPWLKFVFIGFKFMTSWWEYVLFFMANL